MKQIVFYFLTVLLAFSTYSCIQIGMPGSNSDLIGKDTPEFNMEDICGNLISTANTKGKIVVLNF